MQKSSADTAFCPGLRLELPYLVDALSKDHGFLHDADQFGFLAEIVADHHRHGSPPLSSFLVAGCDRGIDAYSLCITLLEEAERLPGLEFSILGTDFLPANLNQAMRGVYAASTVRNLPQPWSGATSCAAAPPPMRLFGCGPACAAASASAVRTFFESFCLREPMDVIVCRQVLHHFHPTLATALAGRLRGYLAPGGILALGGRLPKAPGLRHLGHALYQAV
jgi:chemotaxis protein methyltransferase CheR